MRRSILAGSTTLCLSMAFGTSALLAQTAETAGAQLSAETTTAQAAPDAAKVCLADLTAFRTAMEADGHWLGGMGYGYPMMGGYSAGPLPGAPSEAAGGYRNVRPGYEVRTLILGAAVLARHGEQDTCETVLAVAREIYTTYSASMKTGPLGMADVSYDHASQIAAATPVESFSRSVRSDELLGTTVRNAAYDSLGDVDDLIMGPHDGKIAYLTIARGGILGFNEKYVPVPWADFSIAGDGAFLVLEATSAMLKAAPQVDHNQVMTPDHFDKISDAVDAYWAKTLPPKAGN